MKNRLFTLKYLIKFDFKITPKSVPQKLEGLKNKG